MIQTKNNIIVIIYIKNATKNASLCNFFLAWLNSDSPCPSPIAGFGAMIRVGTCGTAIIYHRLHLLLRDNSLLTMNLFRCRLN